MADSKRVSGRQIPSGTSGRAPASTSTSGRQAPQPSSTSGRMAQPQPSSGSGRMAPSSGTSGRTSPTGVSPSGRMTAAPGSGRMAAAPSSTSGRAAAHGSRPVIAAATPRAPSGRAPRGGVESAKPKAKRERGSPALLYCFGALALMGLLAGVLFVGKSNAKKAVEKELEDRAEKYDTNMKLGFDNFTKAENAGLLYCMGKEVDGIVSDDEKLRSKLFGPFLGDDKVYNVLYERRYKDKKAKEKTDQKFLFPERNRIERMENGKNEKDIRVCYGFADNKATPIVIASKTIKAAEGDQANLGGSITVIMKAQDDHLFKAARERKLPVPAAGAPAAETPAAPAAPAAPAEEKPK